MGAVELLDDLILDLEGKLNLGEYRVVVFCVLTSLSDVYLTLYASILAPGEDPVIYVNGNAGEKQQHDKKQKQKPSKDTNSNKNSTTNPNLPDILKLEFKVGLITKVWTHPDADKLYCEEIDCGEQGGPRQIASGLRKHYTESEMLGKRVLVVANLKVCLCSRATMALL